MFCWVCEVGFVFGWLVGLFCFWFGGLVFVVGWVNFVCGCCFGGCCCCVCLLRCGFCLFECLCFCVIVFCLVYGFGFMNVIDFVCFGFMVGSGFWVGWT